MTRHWAGTAPRRTRRTTRRIAPRTPERPSLSRSFESFEHPTAFAGCSPPLNAEVDAIQGARDTAPAGDIAGEKTEIRDAAAARSP